MYRSQPKKIEASCGNCFLVAFTVFERGLLLGDDYSEAKGSKRDSAKLGRTGGEFGPSFGSGLSSWNNKRQSGITRSFHSSVPFSLRRRVTTVRDAREYTSARTPIHSSRRLHPRVPPRVRIFHPDGESRIPNPKSQTSL